MPWKLVTSESMRQADRQAIDKEGIPSLTLMENAGKGIASRFLTQYITNPCATRVVIFCGTGNNGGDGFVIARYLYHAGVDVCCYLVGEISRCSPDCHSNYSKARELSIPIVSISDSATMPSVLTADFVIDALCGTGFSGEPRGILNDCIRVINESNIPCVAVDIPSGVNADDGSCGGQAIHAIGTYTLGLPKYGLFVSPGREHAGNVDVVPIGLPHHVIERTESLCQFMPMSDIAELLPVRKADAHKFDVGTVLIAGGSIGLTGAAALASESALRAGCGMVRVACPATTVPIVAPMIPEATTISLPDVGKRGALALRGLGDLKKSSELCSAVVCGPGMGRHHETAELVRRFVLVCSKPMVVDADAINAFEGKSDILAECKAPIVLTPHGGEFRRLTGEIAADSIHDRIAQATRWSQKLSHTFVMKGSPTLIALPDGNCYLNCTGNHGMATGGSGDVLSGIIGSLMAQGVSPQHSAIAGVYVHGLAGDIAASKVGARSMIARDIIGALPEALRAIERSTNQDK